AGGLLVQRLVAHEGVRREFLRWVEPLALQEFAQLLLEPCGVPACDLHISPSRKCRAGVADCPPAAPNVPRERSVGHPWMQVPGTEPISTRPAWETDWRAGGLDVGVSGYAYRLTPSRTAF